MFRGESVLILLPPNYLISCVKASMVLRCVTYTDCSLLVIFVALTYCTKVQYIAVTK